MNKNVKHVVVITDCKDVAFNEMKWIIKSECLKMNCNEVEIELLPISEFSIINASFLTRLIAEHCTSGTVLSVVINPSKNRYSRIYGELPNGVKFFGANTGALTWLINDFDVKELYEIHDPGFVSFGGKFVHAPNVAKLVADIPYGQFGKRFLKESLTELNIKEGTIIHIDNFGLMKIKGESPKYDEGQKVKIFVNREYKFDAKFSNRMMSNEDKEWILYKGSSLDGLPELGTVRYKSGYRDEGFNIGDIVTWKKI